MTYQTSPKISVIGLTAGLSAMTLAVYFIFLGKISPVVLIASIFFCLICFTDMFWSRIPNPLNLGLLLAGLTYNIYFDGFNGLLWALLGVLTGLALFLAPYLLSGMGAGDVKALAALGGLLGPVNIFHVFLYTALIGGGLALLYIALACKPSKTTVAGANALRTFIYTRDIGCLKPDPAIEKTRFPYAPAIAFGYFAFIRWGAIV